VNVLGSLLLGLLTGSGAPVPLVVGVGGLGAMTTFSTFAADTMALADHHRLKAAGHVATTLVLGLGAALLGLVVAS
jgi:CrcB protein